MLLPVEGSCHKEHSCTYQNFILITRDTLGSSEALALTV